MALLTYFYEEFLNDPKSYTALRFGLLNGLGFGALGCFGIAYLAFALILAGAVSTGSITKV